MAALLVDTMAVLWWLGDDRRLSDDARSRLADPGNALYVSAASIWEAAMKQSLGKLEVDEELLAVLEEEGFAVLAVSAPHAWKVRELPLHHRDPFDRLIVAQALCEELELVSADAALDAYGVSRHW